MRRKYYRSFLNTSICCCYVAEEAANTHRTKQENKNVELNKYKQQMMMTPMMMLFCDNDGEKEIQHKNIQTDDTEKN